MDDSVLNYLIINTGQQPWLWLSGDVNDSVKLIFLLMRFNIEVIYPIWPKQLMEHQQTHDEPTSI